MKLYDELASWWPLLSPPEDHAEEAACYAEWLLGATFPPPCTLLELGSGGGNNASHLGAHFDMTLVDCSPGMLAVSKKLNPKPAHVEGDMRTVRLGRQFDAVFIHDAICYMTTEADLRAALETAFVHCRPGGVALFAPDYVRETFAPSTEHGGTDSESQGLRYLEWAFDPDPTDTTFITDFVCAIRDHDGTVRVEHDRHLEGLFARADWVRLLRQVGFGEPRVIPDKWGRELFGVVKPKHER